MIRKERIPFIILAFASLLLGLTAGLSRIGWNFVIPNTVPHHGAIMIGGFLGTLSSLEKVSRLKCRWLGLSPFT